MGKEFHRKREIEVFLIDNLKDMGKLNFYPNRLSWLNASEIQSQNISDFFIILDQSCCVAARNWVFILLLSLFFLKDLCLNESIAYENFNIGDGIRLIKRELVHTLKRSCEGVRVYLAVRYRRNRIKDFYLQIGP